MWRMDLSKLMKLYTPRKVKFTVCKFKKHREKRGSINNHKMSCLYSNVDALMLDCVSKNG